MAIRAGQILHLTNGFVIDRIQTAGPGNLNIPQERVYELGNYQSVGLVRDTPELSFSLDCLDVGTEVEALLCGATNPNADAAGTLYDLSACTPLDILSPWKSPYGGFTGVKGVAITHLSLESASYRYGVKDQAGENFSLKGDSIFYIPGGPRTQTFTGDGTTTAFTFSPGPALAYTVGGATTYALNVRVDGVRMFRGADYTDTAAGITFLTAPAASAKITVVYGTAATASYAQSLHEGTTVRPAAIKGRDIDVYFSTTVTVGTAVTNKALTSNVATITTSTAHGLVIGDSVTVSISDAVFDGTFTVVAVPTGTTFTYAKTNANVVSTAASGTVKKAVEIRWPDVQSVSVEWRVQLEEDFEFGNKVAVGRDYSSVPDVTGSVEIKPRSIDALFTRLQQITGVSASEIIGAESSVVGALRISLRNPESGGTSAASIGAILKTVYMPAVRFTIPGYEGRNQQKMMSTLSFQSEDGVLSIYKGAKP